jgi:ribonucleoside-diphosphate reductase alpha chain
MRVLKRNGKEEVFNDKKIHKRVERACKGIDHVDPKTIVYNSTLKLYDGVRTEEIDQALIKSSRALIEQQPEYSSVAAAILLNSLYKEVFGESVDSDAVQYQYRKAFVTNIKKLVKEGVLAKDLLKFDLKQLAEHIDIKRDELFEYAGLQTVVDRYLIKSNNSIVESPQAWWMRIAMGLALGEKVEERTDYAIKFYNVLSEMLYVPSTPTLFYSGAVRSQLSSCFLNTFEDSVFGIFDGLHQEAQKSKFAGGLGMDFTPFRAGGALINSTGGKTTGAVYTWKLFNDMLVSINQGGKRRGAGCGYLATWHYDIEDFLELKKNTGDERKRCHDLNTAHWIPDLFMKQVESEGKWYLFSPEEVPDLQETFGDEFEQRYWWYVEKGKAGELRLFREVNAKDLWKKMLKMLFETGHPWITFSDPSNSRYSNQHKGIVRSSNLCLAGDSQIDCIVNGQHMHISIQELVDLFNCGKEIKVMSYNTEKDVYEYCDVTNGALMNENADTITIIDEATNKQIECTPEHKIFTKNRGYVMAKDLVETDELVFS